MSVILRNIQIPLFIKIENGILSSLRAILDEHHLHFEKPIIISTSHILELGGNDVVGTFRNPATVLVEDNTIEKAQAVADEIKEKGNDLVISIGGGRVLDLGKYAATKAGVNYISIPTSPSNDGITSPVAVLKNADGVTESLTVNMPIGILVDTGMLESAPEANIRAGIGDLFSNFSAVKDWQLAYAEGQDRIDDFAASLAVSAAQPIFDTCHGYGSALNIQDRNFLEKLVNGLILSGIAMNINGNSRPVSGAEHKISHAIDALYPGRSMHGIQVAFGALFVEFLRGGDISSWLQFCRNAGLPTTLAELGFTDEEFVAAVEKAPSTRPGRYTILEKRDLSEAQIKEKLTEFNNVV